MIGLLMALAQAPTAHAAHFTGNDSVDNREIRYVDNTVWNDSLTNGVSVWNAVGSVDLKPDIATTAADLVLGDYSASDGLCGFMRYEVGADDIWLNHAYYNGATTSRRRACTAHEIGHAYGLGDHTYSTWNAALMDSCPVCYSSTDPMPTGPASHDRYDYHQLWG